MEVWNINVEFVRCCWYSLGYLLHPSSWEDREILFWLPSVSSWPHNVFAEWHVIRNDMSTSRWKKLRISLQFSVPISPWSIDQEGHVFQMVPLLSGGGIDTNRKHFLGMQVKPSCMMDYFTYKQIQKLLHWVKMQIQPYAVY